MANVYYWLKRIRKTREKEGLLRERFERYEPSYIETLEAVEEHAGEALVDELAEWMLSYARSEHELPRPSDVRAEARRLLDENGVEVPDNSPIKD